MKQSTLTIISVLGAVFIGIGFILLRFAFGEEGSGYLMTLIALGFILLGITEWSKRKEK